MNPKKMKTIGLTVNKNYEFTGKDFKKAIDVVFEKLWKSLEKKKQDEIKKEFSKELSIIERATENG